MRGVISATTRSSSAWKGILAGGVIAGVLDIIFAFVFYGRRGTPPVRILQSIASGLLGKKAFDGGAGTAALGAVFQLIIPTVAAAAYYGFDRALPVVRKHPVACGILYGIVIYGFMNFVVLPLSAIPWKPKFPVETLVPALLAHMFLVGLPIALSIRRFSRKPG
jgi:hypothetical protein